MAKRHRASKFQVSSKIELGLLILAIVWIAITLVLIFIGYDGSDDDATKDVERRTKKKFLRDDAGANENVSNVHNMASSPSSVLLSPVTAMADVRGNLGPVSVVIQKHPGDDWLKDRWQAASDMGGTAIPGQHWIELDFGTSASSSARVRVDKVILDWEAAYAKLYRIESSIDGRKDGAEWCTLYDGSDPTQETRRAETTSGQSPGVKRKMPLHVIHTISTSDNDCPPLRYLRLFIKKPARGWGVSLWQFDVYGSYL